jgi:hypothetical protein
MTGNCWSSAPQGDRHTFSASSAVARLTLALAAARPVAAGVDRGRSFPAFGKTSVASALIRQRYFADFFVFFFARASRSVFFRRLTRFLALSLPLLCPIHLRVIYSCFLVTL